MVGSEGKAESERNPAKHAMAQTSARTRTLRKQNIREVTAFFPKENRLTK